MVEVRLGEKDSLDWALKTFRRKVIRSGLFKDMKKRRFYEKPSAAKKRTAKPPNFVFIFIDDLGWTDLGCFGSKYYETPSIDRLAGEGMVFTNGHFDKMTF